MAARKSSAAKAAPAEISGTATRRLQRPSGSAQAKAPVGQDDFFKNS
jgi:hypothetical protein